MKQITQQQVAEIIKNAPSGTTPAGIVAALRQQGYEMQGYSAPAAAQNTPPQKDAFFSGVKKAATARAENVRQAVYGGGSQSVFEDALQVFGEGAGLGIDVITEGLKAITPDSVEGFIKTGAKDTFNAFGGANNPLVKKGLEALQQGMDAYEKWKTRNPRTARNLEATVNIAAFATEAKGLKEVAFQGAKLAKGGVSTVKDKAILPVQKAAASAKTKIQDAAAGLDQGTKTVLNPKRVIPKEVTKIQDAAGVARIDPAKTSNNATRIRQNLDRYVKQAQKAVVDYSQETPLELAGKKAEEALKAINTKLAKQGELKRAALLTDTSKTVPGASQARQTLRSLSQEKLGVVVGKKGVKNAPGRISKISLDPSDNSLLQEVDDILGKLKERDSVVKIDDAIDAIQDKLYKRKQNVAVPVNRAVEGILRKVTGDLNLQLKRSVGRSYAKANAKYSYFIDTRDKLNKALGIDASKGGSLMKRVFSPTDGGTKQLFKEIRKLTGIDLIEEATLAKFAMEKAGDVRQKSLLEGFIRSGGDVKGALINKAVDFALRKAGDPLNAAYRTIDEARKLNR
jgi:hypothetical protein